MSKYSEAIAKFKFDFSDEKVKSEVEKLLAEESDKYRTKEIYRQIFGLIDLTSLNVTDNEETIRQLTERVNAMEEEFPDMPHVAAICVFPNRVAAIRSHLEVSNVEVAAVAAGFPAAQTFIEVKIAEVSLALSDGADEIDIVLNIGSLLAKEYEEMCDEIGEIKAVCGENTLKVILETGILKSSQLIKEAAILSIYSGADFIKTSTGKIEPAATPEAAYVLCKVIKEHYERTGKMIGFKAAGGISSTEDVIKYYTIVAEVLGEKWLDKKHFRIGASRLANNILSDIYDRGISIF